MNIKDRFENALQADKPIKALNTLVFEFSNEGRTKAEIYNLFEDFIFNLRKNGEGGDANEELLMEVMDALTDWCHPNARLKLPIYLEPDVAELVEKFAKEKEMEADAIVNQWLRNNMAGLQA